VVEVLTIGAIQVRFPFLSPSYWWADSGHLLGKMPPKSVVVNEALSRKKLGRFE